MTCAATLGHNVIWAQVATGAISGAMALLKSGSLLRSVAPIFTKSVQIGLTELVPLLSGCVNRRINHCTFLGHQMRVVPIDWGASEPVQKP